MFTRGKWKPVARRRRSNLDSISKELGPFLHRVPQRRTALEQWIPSLWAEVAGPEIAAVTRYVAVNEGVVKVTVTSSVWAQELSAQATKLRRALNRRLGAEVASSLRFTAAMPRIRRQEESAEDATLEAPDLDAISLEPGVLAALEEELAELEPALRDAIRTLRLKELKLQQYRRLKGWQECPGCGAWYPPEDAHCPICGTTRSPGAR